MIATVKNTKSPQASSIGNLIEYLTKDKGAGHRVEEAWAVNCVSEDLKWARHDMQYTCAENERAKSGKAYHLIISFRSGERPDTETLKDITKSYAEVLGYGEHQYACVAHGDTDNFHVHMAISKVNPHNFTVHTPYGDFSKIAAMSVELEIKHGLERDNHLTSKNVGTSVAQAMERAGGRASLVGYVQRTCLENISKVVDWQELHSMLADSDIALRKKGSGLIFISQSTGVGCKASSVDRSCSLGQLEKRLGRFQEIESKTVAPSRKYEVLPLEVKGGNHLYEAYKEEKKQRLKSIKVLRAENSIQLKDDLKIINQKYDGKIESIRQSLKNPFYSYHYKAKAYKDLAETRKQKAGDIKIIKAGYSQKSKEITQALPQVKWLDWLALRAADGDKEALEYLSKRKPASANNAAEIKGQNEIQTFENRLRQFVSKKGTIFHSKGLRESKESISFRKASDAEILKGLEIAMARFGKEIAANGDDLFKRRVVQIAVKNNLNCVFTDEASRAYKEQLESRKERWQRSRTRDDDAQTVQMKHDAMKYIEARNESRKKVTSIPEHVFCDNTAKIENGIFQGVRNSNKSKLALIEFGGKIFVLPQTDYGAKRLAETGVKVGQSVSIDKGKVSPARGIERD